MGASNGLVYAPGMAEASILCATDLSEAGPRTVDLAIAASKAFGVRLDLVHVLDDADSWWPESPDLKDAADAAREDANETERALEAELENEKARRAGRRASSARRS